MKADRIHGVLLVDKPAGMTSHDAVQKIRRQVGQRRVGHTGTLDPQATGLLVVCLGQATKLSRFLSEMDKTYRARVCLGRTSSTYDAEGVDLSEPAAAVPPLTSDKLAEVLNRYTGIITQQVPAYSAVRVGGQRLYRQARKGTDVEPPEREVQIKRIDLEDFSDPMLTITVACSSGTYIRTLAHDIGRHLGCGGYLAGLRRVSVGHLLVSEAVPVDDIADVVRSGRLAERLLSPDRVLEYGCLTVSDGFAEEVLSGKDLRAVDVVDTEGSFEAGQKVFLRGTDGAILAIGVAETASRDIGRTESGDKLFKYLRVLK
ncbi:MAG: tRNA pseudouridine(55) synthase TruB [Candidatus Zixiibacteriota bacterium]|nr:MAG: tRNA pseudouridine(55) synthase TruB [candidate division Zixibacteria bacterium]